jgi:hypothetical protein
MNLHNTTRTLHTILHLLALCIPRTSQSSQHSISRLQYVLLH